MPADVVVGTPLARLVAQHEDAFPGNVDQEIIALRGKRRIAADTDPVMPENSLLLVGEHVRRRVIAARQRPRALAIALNGLEECHRISRAALRPAAPGMPPPGWVPEPQR